MADVPRPADSVRRETLPNQVRVWVISQYDDARAALADERLSKDHADLSQVIRDQFDAAGHEAHPATAATGEPPPYGSPARRASYRFTTEDVEYGGVVIPAGEVVLVWL
ncbi:hypothetical protein [Amycolatopsis sp. NPDC004378]